MPGISFHVNQDWLPDDVFWPAADDLLALLEELTPVDTGYAQSLWRMSSESGGATYTNDCPYISYLDEGWSDQAPDGMISPALDAFPDILKSYYRDFVAENPYFQPEY